MDKTRDRLSDLPNLDDAHAAYKILSVCLSSCKMMYAMRTTRSDWAQEVFHDFDALMRETVESMLGLPLPTLSWAQAQLGTASGGLGLRSAAAHAPAAFAASVSGTWELCRDLDAAYTWEGSDVGSGVSRSAAMLNATLAPADQADLSGPPADGEALAQSELSSRLEAATLQRLMARAEVVDRARLQAAAAPHAGAWLTAPATSVLGLRLVSAEFTTAAGLRLGVPFLSRETWCPKCDQVLSRRCDHAVRCRGGGDITVRHNSLRDACFHRCLSAGFSAERELSGLLPSDPRRRPADVFVQACPGIGPAALDFAVTCPLQQSMVHDAARRPLAAAMDYEAHKYAGRDTAQRCSSAGFKLVPLVAETLGGWGPAAQGFFRHLAKATANRTGTDVSVATCQLYEHLGITLQRANARAVLSRTSTFWSADHDSTTLATTSRSEAALVLAAAASGG